MSDTHPTEAAPTADAAPTAKPAKKPAAAKKPVAAKKAKPTERPADTFRIVDWARKHKNDPRDARRVALAHADELKKIEVGKHTFPNRVETRVAVSAVWSLATPVKASP